jgi:hypothetical protein
VRGPLGGEDALHLGEQGEEQECDAAQALVGGVDRQRVRKGSHPDVLVRQVVDEVEDLAQVAAEPVEGVHDDGVARAGVAQQRGQAVAVDGGAGLAVDVDVLVGDAGLAERVELAVEALAGGRDPGVAEVEAGGRVVGACCHAPYGTDRPGAFRNLAPYTNLE